MSFEKISKPEQDLKTPLRYRFLNAINSLLKPIDKKIAQDRAEDLVEGSGIVKHLEENGIYLDIGTGPGHILEKLLSKTANKNVKIIGLDPFAKPFAAVRERLEGGERHLFVRGAGQQLPIKEKSLNGAILYFVAHHLPTEDREMLFDEIDVILKDGGKIFLIEDTPGDVEERERVEKWDKRLNFESGPEEHAYLSDAEWKTFFERRGYDLVDETHFADESRKEEEGTIPHSSYVLRRREV